MTSTLQPTSLDATGDFHSIGTDRLVTEPATSMDAHRRGPLLRGTTLAALLSGTAVLYLWGLSASGYANSFYSAAAQAGSQSWKAFIFGSLDAGNAITIDQPPASLWLMALSVRIFGLSSWSILVPQALLGVGTVAVLYASVRRTSGHLAGLIAGALLALTPVAVLMFRFNNPDALLVFLLTAAAYCTLRATEEASGRWLAGAGVLIGLAFLTKMLQAFLVLPAFALVYLIAAPASLRKRFLHLLTAFATMIVSLGWWVAIVELVPASMRPYVERVGEQLGPRSDLRLQRPWPDLRQRRRRQWRPPGGQGGMWGTPGITRLFDGVSGGMIAWLIPAALVLAVFAMIMLGRAHRTNAVRAAIMVWTGWLLVTGLVFSFMAGLSRLLHDRPGPRDRRTHCGSRARAVAGAASLARSRRSDAGCGPHRRDGLRTHRSGTRAVQLAQVGDCRSHPGGGHRISGRQPAAEGTGGGRDRGGPGGRCRRPRGLLAADGGHSSPGIDRHRRFGERCGMAGTGESAVSSRIATLLRENASDYAWVAATNGSQSAARFQLASQSPVMAIGGFNGGDPSPTLAEFQELVSNGRIHYYLAGDNAGGPGGGQGSGSQIASWVAENFTASTVDGVTLYDLTTSQ